jgi:hypothetical protein
LFAERERESVDREGQRGDREGLGTGSKLTEIQRHWAPSPLTLLSLGH